MNGRVALVTGASRGIGRAIAARFVDLGAVVLQPTRDELDLTDPSSVEDYLARLAAPVDILVNNAGVNELAGLSETDRGVLREPLEVHLLSPVRLARALAPGMASRGWGRIVNVTSVWTVVAKERRVPYIVSKSALAGLTHSLAVELAPLGILVNSVAPGFVLTEMTTRNNSVAELRVIADSVPLGRLADPSEIAELVAFVASSRNSFMTGQTLVCDGGFTII